MGSSPLYLAIVVVWAIVLVPMLLRRDATDTTWIPRRSGVGEDPGEELSPDEPDPPAEYPEEAPEQASTGTTGNAPEDLDDRATPDAGAEPAPREEREHLRDTRRERHGEPRLRRATVIARRRRRTTGLVLLLLATAGAALAGLGPWWVVTPPAGLLAGHLALLREAAKLDGERRAAARRARAAARHAQEEAERRQAEAEREAKVIELDSRRREVYDQYADAQLRAAGD